MKFQIRKTSENDIAFYRLCFGNTEFHWNLYGDENMNLKRFVSNEEKHLKFIISKITDDKVEDIAFSHFYYDSKSKDYISLGGVAPKFFNSGMGLYASVAILRYMFKNNLQHTFRTGVFKYNKRALKVWEAIGFRKIKENDDKFILKLTLGQFENDLVHRILDKIETVVLAV